MLVAFTQDRDGQASVSSIASLVSPTGEVPGRPARGLSVLRGWHTSEQGGRSTPGQGRQARDDPKPGDDAEAVRTCERYCSTHVRFECNEEAQTLDASTHRRARVRMLAGMGLRRRSHATRRRISAPASTPCFPAGRRRPRAAPSASARTAGSCSRRPTEWRTSSTTCRTGQTRFSRPGRSPSSSLRLRCSCLRATASCRSMIRSASTFRSCPTTARRSRSGRCCSTRAACATGATWKTSRAGRAARASTRMHTSSTSWVARST